jgi:hypothetical protein
VNRVRCVSNSWQTRLDRSQPSNFEAGRELLSTNHSCPKYVLRNQKNGKALVWSHPLIFFHLGMSVSAYQHTRPACKFDLLSSARALVVRRRNEVGFLPARASQASTFGRLTRETRMLLCCVAASAGRARSHPSSAQNLVLSKITVD